MKSNLKTNTLPELHTNHMRTIPDSLTGVKSIRTATLADADHHHGPMSYSSSSSSSNGNRTHSKTSNPTSSTEGDDDIMNDVVQSTTVSQGDPTLAADSGGTGE